MRFNQITMALTMVLAIFASTALQAQDNKAQRPSPPKTVTQMLDSLSINIVYNAPSVKGRTIWGALVPYGKVWRTGANEATTFEVNKPVLIEGQKLAAGKYSLFTVPGEKEWVVVFNKEASQWGAYSYKKDMDALRVTVKPGKTKLLVEQLAIDVSDKGEVSIAWENVQIAFGVKEAK
jgi:Protein of unknown function (DUF2911)